MARSLNGTGLPFSLFQAVDANDAERLSAVSRYCPRRARWFRRHALRPGAVACFASHYLLWQQCAAGSEPFLIMEDDVDPQPSFADAVALVGRLIERCGMLRLYGMVNQPHVYVEDHDTFRVAHYLRGPRGGQCYALSPEGAANLLKMSHVWIEAVDVHFDRFWIHRMGCLALHPFAVRPIDTTSDIDVRGRQKRVVSPVGSLMAPAVRTYHSWARRLFNADMKSAAIAGAR